MNWFLVLLFMLNASLSAHYLGRRQYGWAMWCALVAGWIVLDGIR
jgi:hypothetical protein